jgi:hypothetical protein
MISLAQLTSAVSEEDVLQLEIDILTSLGYQATSWQPGAIHLTILQLLKKMIADLTVTQARYNRGYHPRLAAEAGDEDFLTLLGTYVYVLPRVDAVNTLGKMVLTASAAAPIHTWDEGELVIAASSDSAAPTYRVLDSGTLNPGGTLEVSVAAEVGGLAWNVPPNLTTLELRTPLVGVTVTNPPVVDPVTLALTTTWITTFGADKEALTHWAERMSLKWSGSLSPGTFDGYKALAFEALPSMVDCDVLEGPGDGEVLIVGATATGGLAPGDITTIEDYFSGAFDGKIRRMINDTLTVESATVVTSPALVLEVTCDSVYANDVASRVTTALENLFAPPTTPIGGELVAPNTVGKVFASKIYQTVMNQLGVRRVTGVPADIALGQTEVYHPVITVTVVRN